MDNKKEIVVICGAGHKGLVKVQFCGQKNVKGTCNLDFRPSNAILYLVGENVAQIRLYDVNTAFEVPFRASDEFGCVVRSSSVTMFGGAIPNSKILKRIDEYNKQKIVESRVKSLSKSVESTLKNTPKIDEKQEVEDGKKEDVAKIGATIKSVNLDEWTKYDGNNFYYAVKPQIDELFVCYPEEKTLNDAVANSKWVHVATDDDYYVVGMLFNEDEPTFICYGVPSKSKHTPPPELETACVWLPVGNDESGYWVIYQSAKTGEIVK